MYMKCITNEIYFAKKNGYYFYVRLLLEEIMKIELKDSSTRFQIVT